MANNLVKVGTVLAAILISVPAVAQMNPPANPPASPSTGQKPLDPNEMICEKQEVVGSRLATRRVCHTRAQWADLRLQDRQGIDKMQTNRGLKGE